MTTGEEIYRKLQARARSDAARTGKPVPTAEYLTRYMLESFLDRLTRTLHVGDFVLKGGILLAVYGVRRPTKDVDVEAVGVAVTPAHLKQVVQDVVDVAVDDGVTFDLGTLTFQEIREGAEYAGLRLRMKTMIGSWVGVVAWDISTGDPIVPRPEKVRLPRLLGDEIEILGYRPETTIAEKGVTILERGTTSTRWRDYIDIVQLFTHHSIDREGLLESARVVARYRGVTLGPIAPRVAGYGAIAQQKWAAWRRKEGVEDISEESLDQQLA